MRTADGAAPPPAMVTCFSAPRCLSTSLMYSFNSRPGCRVVDEPTYASYVLATGAERPYKAELLRAQKTDGAEVLSDLAAMSERQRAEGGMLYVKHIAKLCGASPEMMEASCRCATNGGGRAFILLRDPARVLRSWTRVLPTSLEESGFPALERAFDALSRMVGASRVPVVDGAMLPANPRGALTALCAALGIAFDERMLAWPAGGCAEDGCWAPWWYESLHETTGFDASRRHGGGGGGAAAGAAGGGVGGGREEDEEYREILRECVRIYEKLRSSGSLIVPVDS